MEKRKRWQFTVIIVVLLLTLYNILPTVLFYTKSLREPVDAKEGAGIARAVATRVNRLESEAVSWLRSFAALVHVKPESLAIDAEDPALIRVGFGTDRDATTFRKHLARAGALIPFLPARLMPLSASGSPPAKEVAVQRRVPFRFDPKMREKYFTFVVKRDDRGRISPEYRELLRNRFLSVLLPLEEVSENGYYVRSLTSAEGPVSSEIPLALARNILAYVDLFGEDSPVSQRYYRTFVRADVGERGRVVSRLVRALTDRLAEVRSEKVALRDGVQKERGERREKVALLLSEERALLSAIGVIKRQKTEFTKGIPLPDDAALRALVLRAEGEGEEQRVETGDNNPLVGSVTLDPRHDRMEFRLHADVEAARSRLRSTEAKRKLAGLIYDEVARVARASGEHIVESPHGFRIDLSRLPESKSVLALDLSVMAREQIERIRHVITTRWHPEHVDLCPPSFPVRDFETYDRLPPEEKRLGLVLYAPKGVPEGSERVLKGFRSGSVYVIAKGVREIVRKIGPHPGSPQAKRFMEDIGTLSRLLEENGFGSYSGATLPFTSAYANDLIFESPDFYRPLLMATREGFVTHGLSRYATLELSDRQQRIHTLNRIETAEHEDLLKWKEEYEANRARGRKETQYDVPAPVKSVLYDNFLLSLRKYFRGDERKILRWGLDLSGGKTVVIALRDVNRLPVTNDADIKQTIDELHARVNRLGVSEVAIRQEGDRIALDFPGAQSLSATDLVKGSSMYFHIVNEKFSEGNEALRSSVHNFLQSVWNEAVVTGKKDVGSINAIAFKQLYGSDPGGGVVAPVGEAARTLYDRGLRLQNPEERGESVMFNDALSKIALFRESDSSFSDKTHPLLIVMNNYALEGSNLTDVRASYDPTQGNFLVFNVKGSQTLKDGNTINPRRELYDWTSTFAKETVAGNPLGAYTRNRGWRMAVILNDAIISAPAIESGLRDHVSITGSFTQREANGLEADLKAGSLSFTPHILSEHNVSPDLGIRDRIMGVTATVVALLLVVVLMTGYYRFAGAVASVALLFNLFIMWAALQNIGAALTLAGIAGVVLTVGMAVDANVLVFERIREEIPKTGRLAQAIHVGYGKAFSAIVDSNVTTLMAALILLHFDSGPIKGFAVTLIIGIASSMFSALFMTRYFFLRWVGRTSRPVLHMVDLVKETFFDFLKYEKVSLYVVVFLALVGTALFAIGKETLFGIDFTGGYAFSVEVRPTEKGHYRSAVEKALLRAGFSSEEFQVRELSPSNHIRILLGRSLDKPGRPFSGLPLETDERGVAHGYENNPRIVRTLAALSKGGVLPEPGALKEIGDSWTGVSGQISRAMKREALIGLLVALASILVYIAIRFRMQYALSATLCLFIDVIATLSVVAILHVAGVPVRIDLNTVAALMTIVGYSLNDTIIIFDRIRSDLKQAKKISFRDVVNRALNTTLSRTLMTSGTTLLVLLALLGLGGTAILSLSLVMVIGVVFGTFSSLFIAAPLLLFFDESEKKRRKRAELKADCR
ncbi:MAG: protein translocase subunit SecD [Simkaniaceae bacterium]|nr:protein translocase subunit SecD [Simkaniaceae bacterium]